MEWKGVYNFFNLNNQKYTFFYLGNGLKEGLKILPLKIEKL